MYARDGGDCMKCANGLTMCDFSQFIGVCWTCDDDESARALTQTRTSEKKKRIKSIKVNK